MSSSSCIDRLIFHFTSFHSFFCCFVYVMRIEYFLLLYLFLSLTKKNFVVLLNIKKKHQETWIEYIVWLAHYSSFNVVCVNCFGCCAVCSVHMSVKFHRNCTLSMLLLTIFLFILFFHFCFRFATLFLSVFPLPRFRLCLLEAAMSTLFRYQSVKYIDHVR